MIPELYDEAIDAPQTEDPKLWDIGNLRALMIRLQQAGRERDELLAIKKAVTIAYDDKEEWLNGQINEMRSSLEVWILDFNNGEKISFPDVGTAYLTTRKAKPIVADEHVFETWARGQGFVMEVVDKTLAMGAVKETGVIPPGVEIQPESKTLAVRPA